MGRKKDILRRAGWLALALLFLVTGLGVGIYYFWQGTHKPKDTTQTQTQKNNVLKGTKLPGFTPIAKVDKLRFADLKKGTGNTVGPNSTITVQYIGALASTGVIFDSSIDRNQPFTTKLSGVITGWQALQGMKVNGERRLLIPAALGYGSQGAGADIPPNSDLVFDVILIDVK